jgi:hypothetical protein
MERRLCEQEVRLNSDGEKNKITGTAVVFYREGDKRHRVRPCRLRHARRQRAHYARSFKACSGQIARRDARPQSGCILRCEPFARFGDSRTSAGTLKLSVDDEGCTMKRPQPIQQWAAMHLKTPEPVTSAAARLRSALPKVATSGPVMRTALNTRGAPDRQTSRRGLCGLSSLRCH